MRGVVSIILLLSFVVVTVTGLYMMFGEGHRPEGPPPGGDMGAPSGAAPGGPMAGPPEGDRDDDERGPGGPPRRHGIFPKPLHELSSLVCVLAALVHVILNWRPLLCYFGLRRKPRLAA